MNKGTILIVDDTPGSLKLLSYILTGEGYQVLPADSGELALASVAASVPELILLDLHMPGMDGFEVLRRLKAQEKSRDIPVILLTAYTELENRVKGFKLGVVDFISKPFQREELLARVHTHMELYRLRVRLEQQAAELQQTNEQLLIANSVERQQAEKKLQLTQFASDHAPISILWVDEQGRFCYANETVCLEHGYTKEELLALTIHDIDPDYPADIWQDHWQELQGKGNLHFETRHRRKDGSIFPVEVSANFVEFGGMKYNIGFSRNITERKQMQDNLAATLEFSRNLIASMQDGFSVLDRTGCAIDANPALFRMTGFSREELIGICAPFPYWPPEEYENINQAFQKTLKDEATDFELIFMRRNGERFPVIVSPSSVKNPEGDIVGYIATVKDITERKQMEEALIKNQRLLAESQSMGNVGGWEFNVDTMAVTWTEQLHHIHEVEPGYIPTLENGINFYAPTSRPIIAQAVQRAIEQGEPFDVELEIITAKGNLRSVHAIGNADMEHRRVFGFFQDITERKQMQDKLAASLEFNRNLIASMQDGFSLLDRNGCAMDANPALLRMTGFSREELIGICAPHPYWPPEEYENINQAFQKTLKDEATDFELTFMRRNGERFPVIVSPSSVNNTEGDIVGYIATVKDITERKQAEQKLRESLAEH